MKKLISFTKRLFITCITVLFIIFGISNIFKVKHSDELSFFEKVDWNWENENSLYYNLQNEKYLYIDESEIPVVLMKNQTIPKKAPDEKRILVIGDSYIYGSGLTNVNYTWWKQLNKKIKEEGYSNVNVYGIGRYFVNTEDQLEEVLNNDALLKRIEPDLIIMAYIKNDPEVRDETGRNVIREFWEPTPDDNELYRNNPILYKELSERYASMEVDYERLKYMGDLLGKYRWDIWSLLIVEGENLENYKKILKKVDERIKELNIPYFFYATECEPNELVIKANNKVHNAMREMNLPLYIQPLSWADIRETLPYDDEYSDLNANPADTHSGIAKTYHYGLDAYNLLQEKYSFIFENAVMKNINELELNINDTMPYLDVTKIKKNVFKFEYPLKEEKKTIESKFLYYPIEKDYIKLNLEYPKNISKIIVTGKNLKSAEIYVNTINKDYGYDVNEVRKKITPCKNLGKNIYEVNYEITSVNIVAEFNTQDDRTIQIEFVE